MRARGRRIPGEAVIAALGYGVLGVLAGIVGTFSHRQRVTLFGIEIWYGWFVALAAIALIAIGLRATAETRLPVTAFGSGVVLASLLLASGGDGGHSVLVAASGGLGPGEAWTYGAPIVAILPVIWPRLPRRTELPGPDRPGRAYPGRPTEAHPDAARVRRAVGSTDVRTTTAPSGTTEKETES